MTMAKCFSCLRLIPMGKPIEELLDEGIPVFCCHDCAMKFPDNGTAEFRLKFKEIRAGLRAYDSGQQASNSCVHVKQASDSAGLPRKSKGEATK